MSAHAARPAPATMTIPYPVAMVSGEHGADSPAVTDDVHRHRWHAWWDLAADRAAERPSTLPVIEWAIGHQMVPDWPLWWFTPAGGLWLLHAAQIDDVDGGGRILLTACLRSTPWTGTVRDNVVDRTQVTVPDDVGRCPQCATGTAGP